MTDKSKIVIVTTVSSKSLYSKTASLFPSEIDKVVIIGAHGLYGLESIKFMFKKLKRKKYDWLIMAYEDLFFYDTNLVFGLIEYMNQNKLDICGVRDGGAIKHRYHNPEAINTFFSIMHFSKISELFDSKQIETFQRFIPSLYFEKNYEGLKYNFDIHSLKEPYYCFYFWAKCNGLNFLYLDVINPVGEDSIGNIILNPDGKKIAFHSWYARAYQVYDAQTKRINGFLTDFGIDNSSIDFKKIRVLNNHYFN